MKKVNVIVETAEKNLSAYIEGVEGIACTGKNLDDIKRSIEESIEMYVEACNEYGYEIPECLIGEYELVYKYDLQSFLSAYGKVLSKSGLETITGINQKQLWHYASGTSKPKKSTVEKVEVAVKAFAKDLMEMEFA